MIKKNDEYFVEITDNGFQGEGIAKIDNIPIFIPNAIKNEKVKIKILKVNTNFCYGKILKIIKKSENRVKEDCNTYNKCGGCNLRHIDYKATLEMKREIVKNNFKKAKLENVKINDCIGMEEPYNYRNKLQYPVGIGENGEPVMGVFAERSHRIIETSECIIQNKISQEIANSIFDFIKQNNIPVYNEEKQTGEIRHIYIRIAIKTNEIMLVLISNKDKITKEKELTKYITNKYSQIKTVVKNINNKNTNVILGEKNEILFGNGYITDVLLGYKFKISPMSFYQVNPLQTEKLYSKAIEYAKQGTENNIALDLYCGIGTIGICASKYFNKIYGIETIEEAIKDANENAKINNIKNAEFFVGDVEEKLPKFIAERNIKPDVIFLDPPRKGVDKTAIETILKIEPKKIIYVSCNPATLVRDLKLLEEKYITKELTPIDMFPFTSHVECVSLLHRKSLEK